MFYTWKRTTEDLGQSIPLKKFFSCSNRRNFCAGSVPILLSASIIFHLEIRGVRKVVLLKLLNYLEFSDNNRLNTGFQHKPQTFPLKSICQNVYEKTGEIHYTLYNLVNTSVLSVASVTVKYYMFRLRMNYLRSWFSFVKQNKHPGEWKTRHIITQYQPRVSIFRVISTCI